MDKIFTKHEMKPNIKAENISAYYNGFCVLQNIDFKCKACELVAIIGKSGAGKTTFLNVLAGFIPFAGEINIPKNISYVFQSHLLFPWMTVEKNIAFGLENMNSEQRNNRVREMLKKIEMPGLHGQKQALDYGVKWSGATVHFVDAGVDTGPIILQAAVPVMDDDTEETLAARILEQEHRIYPKALGLIADGRLHVDGRLVTSAGGDTGARGGGAA